MTESVIVIDFETTGLSPANGARATEVAAVRLVDGKICETFQSLMNGGIRIPPSIEVLTGITTEMIALAPAADEVMRKLVNFVGVLPLVAHNARFDRDFYLSECKRVKIIPKNDFACSMKLAKRVYPRATNYKLQTLLEYADIPNEGNFHRALSDSLATARLWLQMYNDLCVKYSISQISFQQIKKITEQPLNKFEANIRSWKKNI